MMKAWFYKSTSDEPYQTLAVEEAILNHLQGDEVVLYLYRHANSVILGRNQNAWSEFRHEQAQRENCTLARRISGGGAVYHDSGNLNFSFIVPRSRYSLERQCGILRDAIRAFGIDANFSGRNDILAEGRKFSGNAFCFRSENAFHHGTLLVSTDFERMQRYLAAPKAKFKAKGIASVRARVINLSELSEAISVENLSESLIESFSRCYQSPAEELILSEPVLRQTEDLAKRNASWAWIYGQTPPCNVSVSERFPWGCFELQFAVTGGTISYAAAYSDAMDAALVSQIGPALRGLPFRSDDLAACVEKLPASDGFENTLAADVASFLRAQNY